MAIKIRMFLFALLCSGLIGSQAQAQVQMQPQMQSEAQRLKQQAVEEFKKEHYDNAISLLERALNVAKTASKTASRTASKTNDVAPKNKKTTSESTEEATQTAQTLAEIYYYLGWFNHYRAYDSRPLKGYDYAYSQRIFDYLDSAININSKYGDAIYFYGAECSGNAFFAMQNYDVAKLKYFYKKAYNKGAYPLWLIEFGKNFLNSCDKDAILFTGGNADFDVCMYLQLHQNYRTDITVIPLGNIDRPWYVKFLRDGLAGVETGGVRKINLNLTDEQIEDIHPFKWDTTTVNIPVAQSLKNEFGIDTFEWTVAPDLMSNRMHSKMIQGEQSKPRTYLSPQRAILLQIVEDNLKERPVYFSNIAAPEFYGGLEKNFENCGLTSQLIPAASQTDISKLEALCRAENFKDFSTLHDLFMPRITGPIFYIYNRAFILLAEHYKKNNETKKLKELAETYKKCLAIGVMGEEWEQEVLKSIVE